MDFVQRLEMLEQRLAFTRALAWVTRRPGLAGAPGSRRPRRS
ncbi:hypothetical protein AB0875_18425 [Micromonospora gifhornensis]